MDGQMNKWINKRINGWMDPVAEEPMGHQGHVPPPQKKLQHAECAPPPNFTLKYAICREQ